MNLPWLIFKLGSSCMHKCGV